MGIRSLFKSKPSGSGDGRDNHFSLKYLKVRKLNNTGAQSSPSPSIPLSFPDGVEAWHPNPNAKVDICFVHGLTGNRDSTWTYPGQAEPWPKTLLPKDLPDARLLTFGYDAYVVNNSVASTNRLNDHASNLMNDLCRGRASAGAQGRPIILVAHGLGGLVCKKAILRSRNNPDQRLRELFDSFRGIIFMGTPHKGSWMADWVKIPAGALGVVKSVNKSLLQILQTENQLLEDVQITFWEMMRQQRESGRELEVVCFFEELGLPVVGPIVSKASATLEGWQSLSIHANHANMVKFPSEEHTGYIRVKDILWD
ncbi:Alpha/Beta hydrolase protein [Chaetomium sp. MPI-SDFR-AT-0129]|nr:Alpha/Beta hydrolase protein [Chaetomium sp. MPI-SDFR-AT-0129]